MGKEQVDIANLWAICILCLLREAPMHPYEMQRLIGQRKKDDFLDLKRGSIYSNIERLVRAGLIESMERRRDGKRPERTVYRLTGGGRGGLPRRLAELLSNPAHGPVAFLAALSFLGHLTPADALEQLGA